MSLDGSALVTAVYVLSIAKISGIELSTSSRGNLLDKDIYYSKS